MAAQLLPNHGRAIGLAGAIAAHALVIASLLLLASDPPPMSVSPAQLVAVSLTEPPAPPPPPPDDAEAGAAAPPSRGPDRAPSPPEPPRPLAVPTPAEPSVDPGSAEAAGAGAAPGSGAGRGGEGAGSGSGGAGNGAGSGLVTQPVRIAGTFSDADYRRVRPPAGAAGQVVVTMRVRSDGRVDRCRLARSSGFAVFDQATCRLIEDRFRFRPAHDEAGRALDREIQWMADWRPR